MRKGECENNRGCENLAIRINYTANTVLDKPLIALNGIMVLWLLVLPVPCIFPIYSLSCQRSPYFVVIRYRIRATRLICPLRPFVACRTPQALQAPRSDTEPRPFYRYRTAMAAGVADNSEIRGKCIAGRQPCPLCQVFCLVDLTGIGEKFKAGFGRCRRDDLHA